MIGSTILKTESDQIWLQQAFLPLDQGTEFKHAPAQRIRDLLRNSTHTGRSSESSASSTLFKHSWISSSQSDQKETHRTYHLMKLRFIDVSASSGSRLQGTINNAWNSSQFTSLVKICALSNTGLHVSLSQSNDRDIVTTGEPLTAIIISQTFNLNLSALSSGYVILLRWMERQGCEHASHLARFSGFQSSTPQLLLEPTTI